MSKILPGVNSNLEEYIPFSSVDFIISDIDGTLISGTDSVLEQIKRVIKNLKQQKVHLTVATGRTFTGAKKLLKELDIKVGMPVALYNGSVVIEYGTENVLYSEYIENQDVLKILEILPLNFTNAYLYSCVPNLNAFRQENDEGLIENVYGVGKKDRRYDFNGAEIQWIESSDINAFLISTILVENNGVEEKYINQLKEYINFHGGISYTDSGNGFIEIKAGEISKGIIFEILKRQAKYEANKILAIGDNDNDQELFKCADIGVAVANSSIHAIEQADYICQNESASGFLDMLNVIKAAKKYW